MLVPMKVWISFAIRMMAFTAMLLLPAGTWHWWEAWVVVVLWTLWGVVIIPLLAKFDPALLAERIKPKFIQKEQKSWDKVLMILMLITGFGIYIVPGLDVVRFGWSNPLPLWIEVTAMLIQIPGFILLGWVMLANTYLSPVVKIDKARDHHVITTGPYAYVRHPMYIVVIFLLFAVPLALGSRYALIPAALTTLIFVVRTYYEDRTLHAELPGYREYAAKTRYRLIPGIW